MARKNIYALYMRKEEEPTQTPLPCDILFY